MFFATNTDEVLSGAIKSNRFQVALKIVRELTQSRNIVNENDWLSLFKVSWYHSDRGAEESACRTYMQYYRIETQ